ncbi:MAG: ATP-binding protein [Nocardioidaceae bacterium]
MATTEPAARRLALASFVLVAVLYVAAIVLHALASSLGVGDVVTAVLILAVPVVGLVVCRQQPRNRIGWILLAVGLIWGLAGTLDGYGQWGLQRGAPGGKLAEALSNGLWAPALGLMATYLVLLFPDGRMLSRRWLPLAWLSGVSMVAMYVVILTSARWLDLPGTRIANPLQIEAFTHAIGVLVIAVILLPLCSLACVAALVLRYRRSHGEERLQLKWFVVAAASLAVVFLASIGGSAVFSTPEGPNPGWVNGLQLLLTLVVGLVPVAIGIAVLKYNLYEIDVVISKAVVFGALAVFITGGYVAIVVGLGALLPRVMQVNDLVLSVLATAVVAVAFQPVRVRVQRYANRLVYGARATPYEVLSEFASRMRRTRAVTDQLPYMARMVAEGIGASRTEVWLMVGDSLTREACWPVEAADGTAVPAADGTLPALPADRVVAVRQEDELLGAIAVSKTGGEPLTPTEEKLLDDVAAQAGLVLRNARLIEDLRSSRQRLVRAQDEERRRLERDLHDGAQQSLVAVALTLRMASGQPDNAAAVNAAAEQLSEAIESLRELARGIHPAILTERGLGPAVTSLAERSPVPVELTDHLDRRLPATIEATAYFVVAEALTNAAKHAEASQVTVTLEETSDPDVVTVVVADDGRGGVDLSHGTGLRGLTDRVAAADGELQVDSRPQRGTRITCRLPAPRQRIPEQPTGAEHDARTRVGADR